MTLKSIELYSARMSMSAFYPNQMQFAGLMYVALKLNGEAGEFAEKVGKTLRDDHIHLLAGANRIPAERYEAMIGELGDVLWYVNQACKELGIPLREVFERNIAKLESRRVRGTLSGSGDDR